MTLSIIMNQTIVVALASFGMSGRIFHAPLLSADSRFRIARICRRSPMSAHVGIPAVSVSTRFEDLLNDPAIDLVIVNTPDDTHFDLALRALQAGKHVVVEKPFTQTVEQAKTLISEARRADRLLSVFHNRRWDGDFLTVQRLLQEGSLGRIVQYEAHFDRYRPIVPENTWKERPESGAGLLYNLGSHMIDQALVLFGMPEAVTAHLGIRRSGSGVDDWHDIHLHYSDTSVSIRASLLVCEQGPRYIIHGDEGSFYKYGIDPQEEALKNGELPGDSNWGSEEKRWWGTMTTERKGLRATTTIETLPGNYPAYYENVYEAIVNGKPPAVPAEDGLRVIQIIEAAKRSNTERRTIALGSI
jgi:predicted dehydrogenase